MAGSPRRRLKKLWMNDEHELFDKVAQKLIGEGAIEESELEIIKGKAVALLKRRGLTKGPKKK